MSAIVAVAIDPMLMKRVDIGLRTMKNCYDMESKTRCYFGYDLSLKEYEDLLVELGSANEAKYIKRDMERLIEFNNRLQKYKDDAISRFRNPIKSTLSEVIEEVDISHTELLNKVENIFVERILALCAIERDCKDCIRLLYSTNFISKVISRLFEFTNYMKQGFTNIINKCGEDSMYSSNYRLYDKLLSFNNRICYIIDDTYDHIIHAINDFLNRGGSTLNSIEMVKAYTNNIIDLLVTHINNNVLPSAMKYLQSRICDEILTNEIVHVDEPKQAIELSFDSFIDTLINEQYNIDELVELYQNYFSKNINSRALGSLLTQSNRFSKSRSMINGRKVAVYRRL